MSQQPRITPNRTGRPRTTPTVRTQQSRAPAGAHVNFNWATLPAHMLPEIKELPDNMREADFTTITLKLALHWGWCATHFRAALRQSGNYSTPVQGMKGSPDLLLARNGVVLLAELKSNRGTMRPEQKIWKASLGRTYRQWRPRDWPDIITELRPTA